MNRRSFLSTALSTTALGAAGLSSVRPARARTVQPGKGPRITRVRYFATHQDAAKRPSKVPGLFNQSTNVVLVETENGITGIGEGGSKDTIEQCAAVVIGQDAFRTEELWQILLRGYFYPAGREKLHAIGAIDMALWDIKAKALGVPLYQLLGGQTREHVECYATGFPGKGTLAETAKACLAAGYHTFRIGPADGNPWDRFDNVTRTAEMCREVRAAVGKDGAWALDMHTRFDYADAVHLCQKIEDLGAYFVEDLVRSENAAVYRNLRQQVKAPIAVGEQFGARWDMNELIENRLVDYIRATVPNVGGITEYQKIAALCETHYIGLIPHFTGPISEAALVHLACSFSGPVLMEMVPGATTGFAYLPQCYDFRDGKLWPNERPGLGVTVDESKLELISEITEHHDHVTPYRRSDGSFTNW